MSTRTLQILSILSALCLAAALAAPAVAKPKIFSTSGAAKEKDEPQSFLSSYDKLVEGKDADWVYFPSGSLKTFKTVAIKEFVSNSKEEHKLESKHAAEYGKSYLEKWVTKQGFTVGDKGAELTLEGNVFNAWEPSGAGRFWGGVMASPGCGLELVAKDSSGKVVGEIRHKAHGSTIKDCVENGLEEMARSIAAGK